MNIVRSNERYFVAETTRDLHNVALKLLNERRMFENPGPRRDLFEQVCADMDGDTAYAIIKAEQGIDIIRAEVL